MSDTHATFGYQRIVERVGGRRQVTVVVMTSDKDGTPRGKEVQGLVADFWESLSASDPRPDPPADPKEQT